MKRKTIDLVYIGIAAAIIAICSWISIPLPTGVPITLQTLGICLVSATLGLKRGTLATLTYILIGLIGVPVFSGFTSGVAIITGTTGGYLLGFVFISLLVGLASNFCDKKDLNRAKKYVLLILSMLIGLLLCYAFGTAWFAVMWARTKEPAAIGTILSWCVLPYIIPDLVKIAVAASISIPLKSAIKRFN